jgi:hypothetical protein
MEDEQDTLAGNGSALDRTDLREWIRSDLARRGMADSLCEMLARKLEPTVAKLSDDEAAAVLGSVATAYGEQLSDLECGGIGPGEIADVQRLMQGFREEVQKLDEGLRVLSAYVSRLRKRGSDHIGEPLH